MIPRKGEFYGPNHTETICLASSNFCGISLICSIDCKEYRSIMVIGFAFIKFFGSISRSLSHFEVTFLLFFFQPSQTLEPTSEVEIFHLCISHHKYCCIMKRRREKANGCWNILYHPERRDQELGWVGKTNR